MLFHNVQKLMGLFVQELTDRMSLTTLEQEKTSPIVSAITSSSTGDVFQKNMIIVSNNNMEKYVSKEVFSICAACIY